MEILINNIQQILDDKLSVAERGILITILLLKDSDLKITLAKVRVKIKISEHRSELISLHEKGFIKWKGYKRAKQLIEQEAITPEVRECIIFFNRTCKRNFDFTSTETTKNLRNRLLDHSVEDIKLVIANRYLAWRDDKVMSKHLNPTTIFRPSKFPKYLEEAKRTKEGSSLTNAEEINLKKGDEITFEIAQKLVKDDVYKIKTWTMDRGEKKNPVQQTLPGAMIINLLKIQNKRVKRGDKIEFYYEYNQ